MHSSAGCVRSFVCDFSLCVRLYVVPGFIVFDCVYVAFGMCVCVCVCASSCVRFEFWFRLNMKKLLNVLVIIF